MILRIIHVVDMPSGHNNTARACHKGISQKQGSHQNVRLLSPSGLERSHAFVLVQSV